MAKKFRVALDPGHGGSDPGAVGNNLKEKDLTLQLSLDVSHELFLLGMETFLTRSKDEAVSLPNRTDRINAWDPDVSLSIHINSFWKASANGIEIYYHPLAINYDADFANAVWHRVKELGFTQRGVKTKDLHMVREIKPGIPAALIEVGFIKNKDDMNYLATEWKTVVKAIALGIADYLKVLPTPPVQPTEPEPSLEEQIKTKTKELYNLTLKL